MHVEGAVGRQSTGGVVGINDVSQWIPPVRLGRFRSRAGHTPHTVVDFYYCIIHLPETRGLKTCMHFISPHILVHSSVGLKFSTGMAVSFAQGIIRLKSRCWLD